MNTNKLLLGALALGLSATTFAQPDKYVVLEEKTGTWCGFCPSGTVAFANLEATEDKFIGIAIHNSDPMQNPYYDSQSASLPDFGGYPYACADRVVGAHAASSPTSFSERENEIPVAAVTVAGYVVGDQLEIRVLAEFAEQVTGDWRLAAVVTEDGVTGTASGYAQSNYFAGGSYGALSGAGRDWHTSPNPVPASEMVYDHVARVVADNAYGGVEGSVPASVEADELVWYSFYVDINPTWDLSNVHVVAMLIAPDGSINNAGTSTIGTVSLEEEVANSFSITAFPNPANDFINVNVSLVEAASVTLEVVNMLGAVVSTIETQNLPAGTHYNELDLSGLTTGVYFVKTTVNEKVEMTKIVIQ